jgi:hypothetical protein
LIVVLWRASGCASKRRCRSPNATSIRRRGSLLVRRARVAGREVGMDELAPEHLQPWLEARAELPVASLFCVVTGPGPRATPV